MKQHYQILIGSMDIGREELIKKIILDHAPAAELEIKPDPVEKFSVAHIYHNNHELHQIFRDHGIIPENVEKKS